MRIKNQISTYNTLEKQPHKTNLYPPYENKNGPICPIDHSTCTVFVLLIPRFPLLPLYTFHSASFINHLQNNEVFVIIMEMKF